MGCNVMFLFNNKNLNVFYGRLFWTIIICSFFAWFVGIMIEPQGYQLDLFSFRMEDFWGDATVVTHFVKEKDPYSFTRSNYPPLSYMFYYILALVSVVPNGGYQHYFYQPLWTTMFCLFLFVTIGLIWQICITQMQNIPHVDAVMIGLAFCLSKHMIVAFERGNVIILAVLMTIIFVFYYDSNTRWKKEGALIALAVAICIKLSPAIFGFLLVRNRDWKGVLRLSIYFILLFFAPFLFFEGGLSDCGRLYYNLFNFLDYYAVSGAVAGTGIATSFLRLGIILFDADITASTYMIFRVLGIELSFFLLCSIFHEEEKWKQVLNLTIIQLLVPAVSFRYNFLFFIPSFILFLNYLSLYSVECDFRITMDKIIIFASFIMMTFVYRCTISDIFDEHFSILLLTAVGTYYSVHAFRKSGHVLPTDLFKKR